MTANAADASATATATGPAADSNTDSDSDADTTAGPTSLAPHAGAPLETQQPQPANESKHGSTVLGIASLDAPRPNKRKFDSAQSAAVSVTDKPQPSTPPESG